MAQTITIERASIVADQTILGYRSSANRIYLGYIECNYEITGDVDMTLHFRRDRGDTPVETLTYSLDQLENYFFQKLPPNISCYEFWYSFEGTCTSLKITRTNVKHAELKVGSNG